MRFDAGVVWPSTRGYARCNHLPAEASRDSQSPSMSQWLAQLFHNPAFKEMFDRSGIKTFARESLYIRFGANDR